MEISWGRIKCKFFVNDPFGDMLGIFQKTACLGEEMVI